MRKCLIGFAVYMIINLFSLFAVETGAIEFKYWFMYEIPETVSDMFFTNTSKQRINAYPLNVELSLSNPQFYAAVYSNVASTDYTVTLSFSTLTKSKKGGDLHLHYNAKVYRLSDLGELSVINFDDLESNTIIVNNDDSLTSVSFSLDRTQDYTNHTFYYPIAFQLTDNIENFECGSYSGTIQIEVAVT